MGANKSLLHVVHLNAAAISIGSQKNNKSLALRRLKIADDYYEREKGEKRWRFVIEEVKDMQNNKIRGREKNDGDFALRKLMIIQEMDEMTDFYSLNAI